MTDAALPEPLVPAEVDLRDLDGFMLNVQRLLASELWALTRGQPEAFRGSCALWCKAWHQVPASSLPADEATLAAFAEMPLPRFRKLRPLVMRGFDACADGRLYHRVLAAEAVKAWQRKVAFQAKREADRKRLEQWRANRRSRGDDTPDETEGETRFVAEGQGQGQGQGHSSSLRSEEDPPSLRSGGPREADDPADNDLLAMPETLGKRAKATRLAADWKPSDAEIAYARDRGFPDQQIADIAANFLDYWTVGNGRNKTHADWTRAWQGWVRKENPRRAGAANGAASRPLVSPRIAAIRAGFNQFMRGRSEPPVRPGAVEPGGLAAEPARDGGADRGPVRGLAAADE